ncbi:MAG: (2Fe-2S) ferredoxin domain-containing protein [Cellulosilyticum sp.]|nr:(2Fe-2S) ferredoxin domain-containing protein [Cellulosilyticum sp.]MEE1070936.1 (2Fe-2S) ferredoxin domain-containing protein [Cellulosilyticum sp.]
MPKMMSLEELQALREKVKASIDLREKGDQAEKMVIVRVAMATCGIAAGAREIMSYFLDEAQHRNLTNIMVTQSGCMGYCYAEPTVEVTKPGEEPIVYGYVTKERAQEIIEKYILGGELVEGIIPVSHQSLDE